MVRQLDSSLQPLTPSLQATAIEKGNGYAHDPEFTQRAFGGEFQPGLHMPQPRKFANPAPLGLSAFALTTFVLSLVNVRARGLDEPNLVLALAYGYGGFVQLLAGMWYVDLSTKQTKADRAGKWPLATPSARPRCRPTAASGCRSASS
jgi:GPR1/FUN34/yaaH family